MRGNAVGLILSVVLIGSGYGIYVLLAKKNRTLARKVLHIIVGNWFFIYRFCFTSSLPAVIGLLVFALVNLLLEICCLHTGRFGTVFYPLSIIGLLLLNDRGVGNIVSLGCGILVMAYGDGLAAIAGTEIKSRRMPFSSKKTVLGSLTMFTVSTAVLLIFGCPVLQSFAIGLASALIEAYTPFGLDNILVPIFVYLSVTVLC